MRKIYCLLLAVCIAVVANSQVTVNVTNPTNTTPNLAASYPSLALALTDLNAVTAMSGPVTLTCVTGSETAPSAAGFTIGSATLNPVLSATNTVTINTSGGAVTLNAAAGGTGTPSVAVQDGILKIVGADYITIDGLTLVDGNAANPATMEFGIGLFKLNLNDGAQNNTIQNCTITLNRINNASGSGPSVEGSRGINVVNATDAAQITSLTPTTAAGTNSNNRFYSNTIQNCNYGIALNGFAATTPFTTGDTGNDIGGSSGATGNTILNYGGAAAATNPAAGIRANNQWGINISYNTVNNNNGSGVNHVSTLRGIYAQAGTSANATINNNNVSVQSGATTSACTAIDNGIGSTAASNTVTINNNTVNIGYPTSTTGVYTAINNSATAATVNINGNTIGQIASVALAGTGTHVMIETGSPTSATTNNNTITNISRTGASGSWRGIKTTSPTNWTVDGNTIDGISWTTVTSTGSFDGIYSFSSAVNVTITNNIVRNVSLPTTGTFRGIVEFGVAGTKTVQNNQVYNASTTAGGAGGATFTGITNSTGTVDLSNNRVYALNSTGTTGGTGGVITGITVTGGTAANVYKNKVYDLSTASTTATSGAVNGILISGNTANTVYNNLVGDLRATASAATDAIRGISSTSTSTSSAVNVYYNTVYLNASSTGANFGTSGIFHTTSTTATTATLNLRNNIIVNLSTPAGTGTTVAYRRSSGAANALTNYAAASNNNLFYAGTPGAANLIYSDGTSTAQTINDYKAGVFTAGTIAPRDQSSVSENPNFLSLVGANANFLHINTAIATQVESGAAPISVTDDFDGDARNVTTPDIGADEFSGIGVDLSAPAISYTPLANTTCITDVTLNPVTITDGSGVNTTPGTKPRLYFKKSTDANTYAGNTNADNGWKYVEATNAASPFSFTTNYTLLQAAVAPGDVIQYFVVAQDNAGTPNVGINSGTFAAPPTSVALTAGAFPLTGTINSYIVAATLPTSITIGAAGTYPTLTGPGGLFAAINSGALSGNTTATIIDAAITETGANALNPISFACGGGPFTLTIKPATGVTTVLSGSFAGPLININGADNVTFDGSNNGTSTKDMTISNTSTSGAVMQFINDATGNTLKNSIILGVVTSSTSGSIVFSTTTGASGNSNNTIDNNDIRDGASVPANAVYSSGSVGGPNANNTITNNNIFNYTASGVLVASTGAGNGWNISSNNVYQTASRTTTTTAISLAGGNNHVVSSNKLYQTTGTLSAAYTGISVTGGTNGHNISSNSIGGSAADRSGAALTVTSSSTNLNAIALSVGTTTATSVNGNTVSNLATTTTSTSSSVFGVNVSGGNVNIGTVEGNTFGGGAAAYDTIRNAYDNGIINNSGSGVVDIQNNVIGNISYYRAGGDRTAGINISAGTATIRGNIIKDFNVNGTGTGFAFLPVGILMSTATSGNLVENNQIFNIRNTNTGTSAYTSAGIVITGNMTSTVVRKNRIYSIMADGTGTGTSSPRVFGIYSSTGSITYSNNMVAAGNTVGLESRITGIEDAGTGTNNYFFNSVSVTGTTSAGTNNTYAFNRSGTATVDIRDNIFSNTRTGGTGFHVAIANTNAAATGWAATASNYNDLYTASPATVGQWLGTNAAANRTFTGWQASQGAGTPGSGGDANSWNYIPGFVSATDLHIPAATVSPLESGGTPAGGITDDIDNQTRPGPAGSVNGGATQVDIGADEFDGTPASVMTYVSSTTTQTNTSNVGVGSLNQQVIGIEVVTAGIVSPLSVTDFTINTNGTTAPLTDITNAKLWYTGNSSTFATTTQFGSTTAAPNGSFVVSGTQVLSTGTNYFWLTYDVPCGAVLTNVIDAECNSITIGGAQTPTVQAPAGSRTIVAGTGLSGIKTIGAAGDYPSLTGAGGLFAAINTNGLSGNLTANIIDASVTETGATALNAVTYVCGGPFTITIKPNTTATLTGTVNAGAVIKLNGADNVTIDGSNSGGSDRSLTIQNLTTTTTGNAVVWLASAAIGNGANGNTIKNCIIEGNSSTTSFTGVHVGGSTAIGLTTAGLENSNNNTINNNLFRKTIYGTTMFGFAAATPDLNNVISNNNYGTAVTGEGHSLLAINADRQSGLTVSGNEVQNVVNATTTSSTPFGGIRLLDFKNGLCFNNKVHDLAYTGTSTPKIYGIAVTSSTYTTVGNPSNAQVYNNIVYRINSTGTSGVWNLTGILASAGYGDKFYYNSVHLTGQLANSSSGLAAAFANGDGNITSVGSNIDVRNNSFSITGSSAVAGGNFWAYYTQATTLAGSILNYNDLYAAGTNVTSNVGRFNGANSATLAAWQAATGQDANSISADPLYNATNNLVPQLGSPLVSAGTPVAGVTTDITGFTRSVTTPTIGAYEQAGDAAGPAITYTPLTFTCATGDRALNGVTITDASGVPTAGPLQPRIYFRKNAGTWFSAQGTLASGTGTNGTWDFTIAAATMGGLTSGDAVQYYVIAQDVAGVPNISSNPSAGLVATDVNTVTTPPTTPNSYTISATIGGTYTVGTAGNYPTLTAAVNAYNTSCLSGPVIFELLDATYSAGETFPILVNANPDASSTNTLTIRPAATVNAAVTGSAASNALIKLNGANYVTIDGSNNGTNSRNLTITNNSATSPTVIAVTSVGTTSVTGNTLKNTTIINGVTTSSAVVVSDATTLGNAGYFTNITIRNNSIQKAYMGVYNNAVVTGTNGNGLMLDSNELNITGADAIRYVGLYVQGVNGATVRNNTIGGFSGTNDEDDKGIWLATGTTNSTVSGNKITSLNYTGVNGYGGHGVFVSSGNATANITVVNNFIANLSGDGWSYTGVPTDNTIGIALTGTQGGVKLYNNSINLSGNTLNQTDAMSMGIFLGAGSNADIRNNIIVNNLGLLTTTGYGAAGVYAATANTQFTNSNYNDYVVNPTGSGNKFIGQIASTGSATLAAWQTATGQDANSLNVVPVFVSATDLHLVPASNCALHRKGTPLAGVTTDIDGETRHATYPDMGADEYAINVTGPVLWTGAINTDWFNVGNWNLCELPGPTSDVTINSALPNYPNVLSNVTIKSLTVNPAASMTVGAGVVITLLGP